MIRLCFCRSPKVPHNFFATSPGDDDQDVK
jgi:hypothetical protein